MARLFRKIYLYLVTAGHVFAIAAGILVPPSSIPKSTVVRAALPV
jgi:hypothetical protein